MFNSRAIYRPERALFNKPTFMFVRPYTQVLRAIYAGILTFGTIGYRYLNYISCCYNHKKKQQEQQKADITL
jgi:hypothetical protein